MANEFIIRKGYKSLASSEITGSLLVLGSISGSTYYGDGSNLTGISIDGGNATTLDSLDSTQFLRSDANDDFSGTLNYTPDTGTILSVDGQAILQRMTANGAITIGHDDAVIIAGGDTSGVLNTNINNATETVFIGAEGGLEVYAFPNNSTTWSNRQRWVFQNDGKLLFGQGGDTNIYRSAANTLKTDDAFRAGATGINTPSSYTAQSPADDLVVGDGTGGSGITIYSNNTNQGAINFANDLDEEGTGDNPVGNRHGVIRYHPNNNYFQIRAGGNSLAATISTSLGQFEGQVSGSIVRASTSFISDAVSTSNNDPGTDNVQVSGYGLIGNRTNLYLTNANTDSGAVVQIGVGGVHNNSPKLTVGVTNSTFNTHVRPVSDSTYNLGSSALRWNVGYFDSLRITNVVTNKILKFDGTDIDDSIMSDDGSTVSVAGDMTVTGTLTAQEFHTEFVSASIVYESGSTKFGDTSDDVHSFTGSLEVSGSGVFNTHIGAPTTPYTNDDQFLKFVSPDGSTGTLVNADNGNTWLNAAGGKDLWLNWYSLASPSSKADLQVGDGNGGSAILSVDATNRRVGINNTSPLRNMHVVGNMAVNAGTGEYYGIFMSGGEGANPSILIGDWHNSSGTIKWDSSGNYLRIDSQHSTANAAIIFSGNDATTEYMRIASTGNVGIGTATNSDGDLTINTPTFHVYGPQTSGAYNLIARFQGGNDSDNTGAAILINHSNDRGLLIEAGRDNSDRAIAHLGLITSAGAHTRVLNMRQDSSTYYVGIGTEVPSQKLHIYDSSDAPLRVESSDGTTGIQFKDNSAQNQLYYVGSSDYFYTTANLTIGGTTNNSSFELEVIGAISSSTYYGDGSNLTAINATTLDTFDSSQFLRSDTADTAAGAITFSEDITLNVAKLLKSSNNPTSNFLDFDDDSTTHNPDSNVTTLGSVSGIALATNLNDGGGGAFTVSTGTSGTRLLTITTAGAATFVGDVSIPVGKKLYLGGGSHTYISEDVDDRLRFFVGGVEFMRFTESTSDTINIYKDSYFNNTGVSGLNNLAFNDPGPDEGISWSGGNWKIYESPNDLTTNTAGNLQFVSGSTRVLSIGKTGETALEVIGSGSTVFEVVGSQGQLFSVTDDLSGTLFAVSDISGTPLLEVDADSTITMGDFGTNALVVTGSKVGIGTDTPTRKLHVKAGSDYPAVFDSTQDYTLGLARSGTEEWWLKTYTDGRFALHENGVGDKITVEAGGNVGIGTTDPTYLLDVNGEVRFRDGNIRGNNSFDFLTTGGAAQQARFKSIQVSTSYSGTLPDNGILFHTDTNLYRSAANTLKTDDSLEVDGRLYADAAFTVTQAASDQNTAQDSGTIPSTTISELIRFQGGYTNGQYTTELVKVDRSGNLPLYFRQSKGTANSFTNLIRIGDHGQTNGTDIFAVFGNARVDGTLTTANVTATSVIYTDEIRDRTGQDLTITAGEASGHLDQGTHNDEVIRLAAESGVKVYSSTDNLTSGLNKVTTLIDSSGHMSIAGDLTVVGGDITLSGTGRIQGVDTVTADSDAANKLYVDNLNTTLNETLAHLRGWVPGYSNSDDTSVRWNRTQDAVEIQSSTDTTTGIVYQARRIVTGETVRFTVMVKGSVAASNGLYLRLYQHDGDMPDGKTHVSNDAGGTYVQEDDRADQAWYENGAITTSWVTFEREYTAPADGYVSLVVLNWGGIGTNSVYIKTPDIQTVKAPNSNKLQGYQWTDSGKNVRGDYIYVGSGGGFFYNDSGTRIRTNNDFYTNNANTYLYGNNTYLGDSSGDNIFVRGNPISGNNWDITAAGAATFASHLTVDTSTLKVDATNNRVGIGTTAPQRSLEAIGPGNDYVSVGVAQLSVNQFTGIHFGYRENNNSYRKSAIVFQRTDLTSSNAQGKVHILNGPQAGGGNATLSDARFTIAENGNVGIGETSPTANLEVYGSGSTVLDIQGSQGQLFSITDDLTGDLFSVSDISGIPILNVNATGDSYFDGNLGIGTTALAANATATVSGSMTFGIPGNGSNTGGRFISIEGNADSSGEGSGRIFFTEHNSSTGQMDAYGMSIGYRGGNASLTTAGGNTWSGLSSIGNGQWGMWGHNNSLDGALIMYGDRAATYVDFASNELRNASLASTVTGGSGLNAVSYNNLTDTPSSLPANGGNSDTVDNLHAASFIRSDADDDVSGHTEWQDNKNVRLGNGADFRMWHDGTNHYFRNYHHAGGNMYWQGEDTGGTNRALLYMYTNSASPYVVLFYGGNTRAATSNAGFDITGTLTATADVVAYSDERIKENIKTIDNALDKVKALRGVSYNRTDLEDKSTKVGVIAQEVQKVLPEVVQEKEDGMLSVSYGNMVSVLIEGMKEQQKQIDELKAIVNKLQNEK